LIKRFMDLSELDAATIERLLRSAARLEKSPRSDVLRGRVLGLLFLNPSLRTLSSMQAGMAQLGGSSFVVTPGQGSWELETRTGVVMDGPAAEHVREAIPVLGQYCDVLGVRSFASGKSLADDLSDAVMRRIADLSPVPFINLESAITHPCQSLADWKTLDDLGVPAARGRFVLSWAWHPKALAYAVPSSTILMAAQRGMDVVVCRPEGFELPAPVMERAAAMARASGGSLSESEDVHVAMEGAHVLYAKSWCAPSAYGRPSEEAELRRPLRDWCVRETWFKRARPGASFMHCLPVRRNVKVADEILDGPRSAVVRQAANRLHVQKAVLQSMLAAGESTS
jgi:N-acetylornithine carbamoyltransferase